MFLSENTVLRHIPADVMDNIVEAGYLNIQSSNEWIYVFVFKSTHASNHELEVLEHWITTGQYYGVR